MTLDEAIKHEEEVADSHHTIMIVKAITEYDLISANYHRQLAEWLKELKQLREQTSWIPVTKRLPDDHDRYLISTDDGMVEMVNYGDTNDLPNEIAFYQWDDEEWQCWKPNVTAWMPRPKAYKSEERGLIPDIRVTAEEAAEELQKLAKAGISQEDIELSDLPLYNPDRKRPESEENI